MEDARAHMLFVTETEPVSSPHRAFSMTNGVGLENVSLNVSDGSARVAVIWGDAQTYVTWKTLLNQFLIYSFKLITRQEEAAFIKY